METPTTDWRKNLHNMVKYMLYPAATKDDGIPNVIVDAIDAAYVQGLEDGQSQRVFRDKVKNIILWIGFVAILIAGAIFARG